MRIQTLLSTAAIMALASCTTVVEEAPAPDPIDAADAAPAVEPAPAPWRLEGRAMAAAADPRAVDAAVEVLKNGGHAVDAAIAAHAVLGLVEPQSSGIGGGRFYDGL